MDNCKPITSDEISLREIIETILRGKIIIAIITIQAIILSGLLSFFVLPEIYESRVVVMANPIDLDKVSKSTNSNDLIEYLTSLPTMTLQTYMEQIQAAEVLNSTIIALDLRESDNKYINAASLRDMINVRNVSGTNLIEIIVSHRDPEMAARIANTISDSFIDYVTSNTRFLGQRAVEMISEQLANEEQNLSDKSQALAEFWKNNKNIDVLREDVNSLKSKLVQTRSTLLNLAGAIETYQTSLAVIESQIRSNPALNIDDFTFSIDLNDASDVQPIEINLGSDNLSEALLRIEISRLQTRLIAAVSEQAVLATKVAEYESSLTALQIELTDSEYKYNALDREMFLAQQSYDAYQQKYKEAMLTVASDIGASSVIVTSAGTIPVSPVAPNKMMNIAIAAVLGLMLGIFIVLFRDYWQKSKPVPCKTDD